MRIASLPLTVINNRLGKVIRPSWCTFLVCFRCNARCQMCDSWRMKPGDEMTPEQVSDVFGKIGRLDIVRLSGGEPFLRDDMLEIAHAVHRRSRPHVIHITTNGSFPEKIEAFARQYENPRGLRFMVSFDGQEIEHDRNRGQEVLFETAMESVRRLAALQDRGIRVSANHTVITPQSMDDHEGLRQRLAAIGVEVHTVLAYAESSMYGVKLRGKSADHMIVPRGYPIHPDLEGADVVEFTRQQLTLVNDHKEFTMRMGKRYYLEGLLERLENREAPQPNPKCVALRSHIRLLPDGSVPVCQFNTETIGNLVTQSFEEVWEGVEARNRRAWVDGCPGCWAECEVMPNALYSGDLFRA